MAQVADGMNLTASGNITNDVEHIDDAPRPACEAESTGLFLGAELLQALKRQTMPSTAQDVPANYSAMLMLKERRDEALERDPMMVFPRTAALDRLIQQGDLRLIFGADSFFKLACSSEGAWEMAMVTEGEDRALHVAVLAFDEDEHEETVYRILEPRPARGTLFAGARLPLGSVLQVHVSSP